MNETIAATIGVVFFVAAIYCCIRIITFKVKRDMEAEK